MSPIFPSATPDKLATSSEDRKTEAQRGKVTCPRPHSCSLGGSGRAQTVRASRSPLRRRPPTAEGPSPQPGGYALTHSDSRGKEDRRAPGPRVCSEVCLLIENRSPEWPRTGAPFSKAEDGSAGLCIAGPGGILVLSPFCSSGGCGGHRSF